MQDDAIVAEELSREARRLWLQGSEIRALAWINKLAAEGKHPQSLAELSKRLAAAVAITIHSGDRLGKEFESALFELYLTSELYDSVAKEYQRRASR